jgi:hypothetical protein
MKTKEEIEHIAEEAQYAFWAKVAELAPEAVSGDFSPMDTVVFDEACLNAVTTWIIDNVPETDRICLVYLYDTQTRIQGEEGLVGHVGCVKFGEDGYYETTFGYQNPEWVKWYNTERLGLLPEEAEAMQTCSMFKNWANYVYIVKSFREKINAKQTTN